MSRIARGGLNLFALLVSLTSAVSLAQRITLVGSGEEKAHLSAAVIAGDRSLAPSMAVHFSMPVIDVTRATDGFDTVQAPGLVPLENLGQPELVTTGALFVVPEGFEPELSIGAMETRTLPEILAKPSQRKFRCGHREHFSFDAKAYETDRNYPAEAVKLETIGRLHGLKLMRVAFYPLQNNPVRKELTALTKLAGKVTFRPTGKVEVVTLPRSIYQIARQVASNGTELDRFVRVQESESILMVVADSLVDAVQPLVDWKRAKGFKVDVVKASVAGATKEKIQKHIKTLYTSTTQKPSYLLFVGNKTTMPGFLESTASGPAASDYSYALLADDDEIPDLPYGRIIADNAEEAAKQVQRAIEYEKNPESGAEWYTKGSTIASNEGADPSDKEYAEQIQEILKAHTYSQVDGFYQGEDTATFANISGALNEGRTWLAYFGHGSGTSWGSTNDTFNNASVEKLANPNRMPILVDVACQNGSWYYLTKCFGKTWVNHQVQGQNAGAVGYYGGSVNISWHPPAIMSVGVAKYHFEKPVPSLGGSVLAGQLYLIEQKGKNEDTLDNVKWYNLFGDPTMNIRTAIPVAYKVAVNSLPSTEGIAVTVQITGTQSEQLANAKVSIMQDGALLATANTDAAGRAEMLLPPNSVATGSLVTVSGYNLETDQVYLR